MGLSETVKPLVFLACSIKSSLYYPLNSKTKPIISKIVFLVIVY